MRVCTVSVQVNLVFLKIGYFYTLLHMMLKHVHAWHSDLSSLSYSRYLPTCGFSTFYCYFIFVKNLLLQYSRTNKMHILYSVYHELTACTCFEHYLLIFSRCYTNNNWYTACVLCLLAATRFEVPI
jgi:hypothetical protein